MFSVIVVFLVSAAVAYYVARVWGQFCESVVQSTVVGVLSGLGAGMMVSTLLAILSGV